MDSGAAPAPLGGVAVSFEVLVTRGPWKLCRARTSSPPWVGWVHESAEGWRREVIRIRAAAERSGAMTGATGANLNNQRLFTRDLVKALGQLARALDLSVSAFAPWAKQVWANDPGPIPWWGWGRDVGGRWEDLVGRWQTEALTRVLGEVPEVARAPMVHLALQPRVNLTLQGVASLDVSMALDAPETPRGVDRRGSSCGVVGDRSVWNCLNWSAWWPGFGYAATDAYVTALVPLGWSWAQAAAAAARVEELGTLETLMAECRAWVALKNVKAIRSLARATPPVEIELPEELLDVVAASSARRWESDESSAILRTAAGVVSAAVPVGPVVGLVLEGVDLLVTLMGRAQGQWLDPWGRVEPVLELPRLTGTLDVERPRRRRTTSFRRRRGTPRRSLFLVGLRLCGGARRALAPPAWCVRGPRRARRRAARRAGRSPRRAARLSACSRRRRTSCGNVTLTLRFIRAPCIAAA
jgi:hypothetical protein